MREWLNAILAFIGSTSITDIEYAGMNLLNVTVQVYDQASYDALSALLVTRESVSTMQSRLIGVFQAKGGSITALEIAKTNIFIGDVL